MHTYLHMQFNKRGKNIQFIILTKIIKLFTLKSYTRSNYKVLNTAVCLSSEAHVLDGKGS